MGQVGHQSCHICLDSDTVSDSFLSQVPACMLCIESNHFHFQITEVITLASHVVVHRSFNSQF